MKPNFCSIFFLLLISVRAFSSEEIIKRPNYTLSYNEDHEVANWVAYELDHWKLQNCVKRSNSFKADPMVSTGSADAEDYKGSGFDRGHLVPAGDMKFNSEAMKDTFYFSNMTPQPPRFNQVRWGQLEHLMRAWGLRYKKIWIVTGPILEENLQVIGNKNKISVPNQYFKVVIRKTENSYEGFAFIMGTDVPYADLREYATTINAVEELAGVDFFQFLDDKVEEKIEGTSELARWDFNEKFEYLPCQTSGFQSQK